MLVFPSNFFAISEKEVDFRMRRVSGGTAISGYEDTISTDGGGIWYAQADSVALHSREKIMTWRAFKSAINGGSDPFIFPICDARHQPFLRRFLTTHSDGTSFSDGTLYTQGDSETHVGADADLRATQIDIDIAALGRELIGGERFTITHETWRERCYQVGQIITQTSSSATVQFHPPLREAVSDGDVIDFNNPRFVARVSNDMTAPMTNPKFATGTVDFIEDMTGSYS